MVQVCDDFNRMVGLRRQWMRTLMLDPTRVPEQYELLSTHNAALFSDNGGEPDGNAWIARDLITVREAHSVLKAGMGVMIGVHVVYSSEEVSRLLGVPISDDKDLWISDLKARADERFAYWSHYGAYDTLDEIWLYSASPNRLEYITTRKEASAQLIATRTMELEEAWQQLPQELKETSQVDPSEYIYKVFGLTSEQLK